jgi:chromodomain-helicase-DNA-binding protein 1
MSMANGHVDEADADLSSSSPQEPQSESDLSDANDIHATTISSTTAARDEVYSDDDAMHDMATSELDEDEDAPGEADADFDVESPQRAQVNAIDQDGSSSDTNSRPGKRKADAEDEEAFMKENPELYGLRRSVRVARHFPPSHPANTSLSGSSQSYATRGKPLPRLLGCRVA